MNAKHSTAALLAIALIASSCHAGLALGTTLEQAVVGLPIVANADQAWRLASTANYKPDGPDNRLRLPLDTLNNGGDCEDIAGLYATLLATVGIEADIVAIEYGPQLHAIVRVGKQLQEPQCYGMVYDPAKVSIAFSMNLGLYLQSCY
jgi:hypothetical protein